MTNDGLKDATLATRLVGELEGHFCVPGYQRGYRWGEPEVRRLLDDVQVSGIEPYFLQPIVVKSQDDGKWELIDGQQRLTTLFLILQYIQKHLPAAQPRYTLEYQTRPDSAAYLSELNPDQQQNNIDFFHIFKALQCIRTWFERQDNPLQAAIDFYTATSKSLQVIWYEAPQHIDSKELFRRLNVGRIPLTDAELVKALVLARVRGAGGESDRAHQVAAQWDVIERDLRDPELWAFVTGSRRSGSRSDCPAGRDTCCSMTAAQYGRVVKRSTAVLAVGVRLLLVRQPVGDPEPACWCAAPTHSRDALATRL